MAGASPLLAAVWRALALVGAVAGMATAFAVPAFALTNPERHYEMVSPAYKGGYGVDALDEVAVAGAGEGERAVFESLGSFSGAPNNLVLGNTYLSVRSPSGWSTVPLMLPATPVMPSGNSAKSTVVSASLESVLFEGALVEHAGESSASSEEGPFREELVLQRFGSVGSPGEVLYEPLTAVGGGAMGRIQPAAVSPDLCRVVLQPGSLLLAQAKGLTRPLYELSAGSSVAGCGGEAPWLRLLAVEAGPKGEQRPINPYCFPLLGSGSSAMSLNLVSADGMTVFFSADPNLGGPSCDGADRSYFPQGPLKLFAWLNGERTVEISTPIPADCAEKTLCRSAVPQRARFTGANEAGTRVFFTTIQPLVTGDTEFVCRETVGRVGAVVEGLGEFETQSDCETGGRTQEGGRWKRFGNDIYMASLECPGGGEACPVSEREVTSLTQVSHSAIPGEAAEVQGEEAVVVSHDGGRVYFVAAGVLTEGANREGRSPMKGADNLYVYDVAENKNRFVADLCSGPERSGVSVDQACPGGSDREQWAGVRKAEATGNGRFLVFTSYGQLVADDTDTTQDIYRYDVAAETLERVSVGENGADRNGNNNDYSVGLPNLSVSGGSPRENDRMNNRVTSEDGSRIVFGTSEPLSSKALIPGVSDVYEWHEGRVSLISSGTGTDTEGEPAYDPAVITPSGRDVFFTSTQDLVLQDTDGLRDMYDARIGQGFTAQAASSRACEADACQGPLTNPAPLLIPGSVPQAAGENVLVENTIKGKIKKARGKPRAKERKRKHPVKRHHGHGSRRGRKASRRGGGR